MADFIPNLAQYRTPLSALLKKTPPPWSALCTKAVKDLKTLAKTLPPLTIPSDGKRVLQTDASDLYWGAVLLEEDTEQKRRICGYKSGAFSPAELHYHSTYKEILAIKKSIEKFEFHLIGHHFLIETDMMSFPNMLKFKQKHLPKAQLLRWANWFSNWSFDAVHIKGKTNVLPDFLSRLKKEINQFSKPHSFVPGCFPMISCFHPLNFPVHLQCHVLELTLLSRCVQMCQNLQHLCIFKYGLDEGPLKGLPFHPVYPFLTQFEVSYHNVFYFKKEAYLLLWYLVDVYTISVFFNKSAVLVYLAHAAFSQVHPPEDYFLKFLLLFGSISFWQQKIRSIPSNPDEDLQFAFWTSRNNRSHPNPDGSITWRKEYHTIFLSTYPKPGSWIDSGNYLVMTQTMCSLNGLTIAEVPSSLLHYETANWKFNDTYPEEWRQNIRYLLDQYHLTDRTEDSSGNSESE